MCALFLARDRNEGRGGDDMYCTFKDRMACLYEDGGRLVRKYLPNKVVLGAQVSGNNVIVQCEDGWTFFYDVDGRLIRKTHGR